MDTDARLDKWIDKRVKSQEADGQVFLRMLQEEETILKTMVDEKQYWEAFNRLNLLFMHQNHELEIISGGKRPFQVSSMLDWISQNKSLIDEIVQGIGGDGYGISPSNYGISMSVSFGTGNIGAPTLKKVTTKTSSSGTRRALTSRTRTPSPSAMRSNVKNPNNPAFRAAGRNRSNQMNPNNPAYRSSRGSGRRR